MTIELKKDYMALHEAKADPHTQYLLVDGTRAGATAGTQNFDNGVDIAGHLAVGGNASVDAGLVINVDEDVTDGVTNVGSAYTTTAVGSPVVGGSTVGIQSFVNYEGTPTLFDFGSIVGQVLKATQNSTSGMNVLIGLQSSVVVEPSTGTVATAIGQDLLALYSGTISVTNAIGLRVNNFSKSGVTNTTGIEIAPQTGGTNNYGITLLGDGAGSDIIFGTGKDSSIHEQGSYLELVPDLQSAGSRYVQTTGDHKVTEVLEGYTNTDVVKRMAMN